MDFHLNYQLKRSKKRIKTISLQIKEDGHIAIYAPYHTPKGEIEKFLDNNQSWILKKLSEKESSIKKVEKAFLPGETFFYLGELYPLDIQESDFKGSPLKLSFGKFILEENRVGEARDLFIKWYKKEAAENLTRRIDYYSHRLQLFPKGIKITSAKHRWGSCSRNNRLSFSWRMIMAPLSAIDYILIHELVHIKEKNHSKRFWNYLESILPEYREHKRWLKEKGHLLQL
jgi:predicted metal-dependent hydrolase